MRDNSDRFAPSPLFWTLAYVALASAGTGMMTHGLFFLTREIYGFGDLENLLLALVFNLPYIPAALLAGRFSRGLGARRAQAVCAAGMIAAALGMAMQPPMWCVWILAPLYNVFMGVQWPIVESYISSGRHGSAMRGAIGAFNITWASTVAPGLWLAGLFVDRPAIAFGSLAALHIVTLLPLSKWPANPAPHDAQAGAAHVGPEYRLLLHSARILLPLSYLLMDTIAPLLPGIMSRLGVGAGVGAALGSTWMLARIGVFVVMYVRRGWHGRWSVLSIGAGLMAVGFAIILIGPRVWIVVGGLLMFGVGQAMVYFAALYYGMAVGHGAVESGGIHEAVIGLGYAGGPALALMGAAVLPKADPASLPVAAVHSEQAALVAVGFATTLGYAAAAWPYRLAKRRRAGLAAAAAEGGGV